MFHFVQQEVQNMVIHQGHFVALETSAEVEVEAVSFPV